ncbi:probable ATP-dependent RNA helicase DDX28 isoform X2 [Anabrus simplex]
MGQTYSKFDIIPLASKGWHHKKSRLDHFTINAFKEAPALTKTSGESFATLGIHQDLIGVLNKQGITEPTTVQESAIPSILSGRNTLIAAETGSGKTLAYLLPLMQQILLWKQSMKDNNFNTPLGLIISPGRELSQQIATVASSFSKELPFNTQFLTGGHTKRKILNPTFDDVDLLIGTLGALSKLTTTGVYRMNQVRHVILDEADTLLDDSFSEHLQHFLRRFLFQFNTSPEGTDVYEGVQLTLASATMPTSLPDALGDIIAPESLKKVTSGHLHHVLPHVPQKFVRLGRSQKPAELLKLVKADVNRKAPVIIFSNKTATCDWVSMFLNENGVKCINLNGDMSVELRAGKFSQFQSGVVGVISCTDVGSRGLDTVRAEHVINYDFPIHMADYIHRCGRTGRVGSSPHCRITNFVSGRQEIQLVQNIELAVRKMDSLPNVNANITKIIRYRILKGMQEAG